MGKILIRNQACLSPSCGSSDARQIYEDGTSHCFSCNRHFGTNGKVAAPPLTLSPPPAPSMGSSMFAPLPKSEASNTSFKPSAGNLREVEGLTSRGMQERGITKAVSEFYGVKVAFDADGNISDHYYKYDNNGVIGYKHRVVATKSFTWVGEAGDIFGIENFPAGSGKRLVITEGELDAMSVAQASLDKYGKIYPAVSMTSSTGVAKLLSHREWIRSFDEVILWFDNDQAGQSALQEALKIVGIDKARIATATGGLKDASDVLVKLGTKEVMNCMFNATQWVPAGIIKKEALWEALISYNNIASIPYPACMRGVNSKVKGMRLGEITLFISGTGSGKSTMLREIGLNILECAEVPVTDKIGVVSLEEAPAETARKFSGMAIDRNPANEEIAIDDLKVGFDKVFGTDRVILLDHQGSITDGSIIDQLEYMILMGCKYLFLDHITILVSEGAEGLTGNEAVDKVMNDLLRLVKRHNVWIGLVSHLRKSPNGTKSFEQGKLPTLDDVRGSGSIKQISFDVIAFARDLSAEDESTRNTISIAVLKSRYTGLTGPVEGAYYISSRGRLVCEQDKPIEQFTQL